MSEPEPFVAIGADELGAPLHPGETVICPHCGELRPAIGPDSGGEMVLAVRCGDTIYLVGIAGQRLK